MNTVPGLVIASSSKMFTPKHSNVLRSSMHRLQENKENSKRITKKITGENNKVTTRVNREN